MKNCIFTKERHKSDARRSITNCVHLLSLCAERNSLFAEKCGWLVPLKYGSSMEDFVVHRHRLPSISWNSDERHGPDCRDNLSKVTLRKLTGQSPSPHNPITLIILTRSIISPLPFRYAVILPSGEISGRHYRTSRLHWQKPMIITSRLR